MKEIIPAIYALWFINQNGIEESVYIGSAANVHNRRNQHFATLRKGTHHNQRLQRIWKKYNEDQFRFEILERLPNADFLIEREQYWIDSIVQEWGRRFLFNGCLTAGNTTGVRPTPETRAKLAAAGRQRSGKYTEETKKKISVALTGREITLEHREKISNTLKGRKKGPRTAETKAKLSAIFKGRRPSDATILASVAACKGRKASPEERERLSELHKGRKFTPEHKLKISAALKGHNVSEITKKKISEAAKARAKEKSIP